MPEMPDVEHFKKCIEKHALRKTIDDVHASDKRMVHKSTFNNFVKTLKGSAFTRVERRGKFLIIELRGSDKNLVMHFGMTGDVAYRKSGDDTDVPYSKVVFEFKNGGMLHWISKRRFGKIFLVDNIDEVETIANMGPEPLEVSGEQFNDLLNEHESRAVKSFFLDQAVIAGIGNEYSDEILFRSGIRPDRKVQELSNKKRKELYERMQATLKQAVNDPDSELSEDWISAHRNGDMKCPKNPSHTLKKKTIAGRSAVYCPKHQT